MSTLSIQFGGVTPPPPAIGALPRREVFGVSLTAAEPEAVLAQIIDWAQAGVAATVDFMPVHGLMVAAGDPDHRQRMNQFDLIAADGQPVRWALNWLHGAGLARRVYGPHMMASVCDAAARDGLPIYLYGGKPQVLEALQAKLRQRHPTLRIAGAQSPPFRPLTPEEDAAATQRINASGARLVFIGLGCPRQEAFAAEHRRSIRAVQLCVGAAFDFHAGVLPMAPPWMQQRGLEWLYRLWQEPGRLWRRYLVTNSQFVLRLAGAVVKKKVVGR